MSKREALLEQIQKLNRMTVHNGCTEAEAKVALEKAQHLMSEYGLTIEEIRAVQFKKEDLCETVASSDDVHEATWCAVTVAEYASCKVWKEGRNVIKFFGLQTDVQVAQYIYGVIGVAMETEFAVYWKTERYCTDIHGRTIRKAFLLGMSRRLNMRIRDLIDARAEVAQSYALVMVKDQIVESEYKALGLKLAKARRPCGRRIGTDRAYFAGQDAAGRVSITSGAVTGGAFAALR